MPRRMWKVVTIFLGKSRLANSKTTFPKADKRTARKRLFGIGERRVILKREGDSRLMMA
jgi:hypothetical protein